MHERAERRHVGWLFGKNCRTYMGAMRCAGHAQSRSVNHDSKLVIYYGNQFSRTRTCLQKGDARDSTQLFHAMALAISPLCIHEAVSSTNRSCE